jgi:hypothetical protein
MMDTTNDYFTQPEMIVDKLEHLLKESDLLGMGFDQGRTDSNQMVIQVDGSEFPDQEKSDVWFLGDIHGDLLGMIAALEYGKQKSVSANKQPWFILLGDFTDRGPYDHLVLLKLFSLVLDDEFRSRLCVIVGNHDECLEYNDDLGKFQATVNPAEFTEWLNTNRDESLWQRLGHATIEFFSRMPRALFLPDGLLVAHAGVPHTDLHEKIDSLESLNEPQCLEDFVWTRAHERAPKRRPNRNTRGCSFGRKDFSAFCNKASEVLTNPVKRMLRGHDHYIEGHKYYEKYKDHQMLTLNTRCIQPDMIDGPCSDTLCIARWEHEQIPTVYNLKTPTQLTSHLNT